jgi:hypothetical protein
MAVTAITAVMAGMRGGSVAVVTVVRRSQFWMEVPVARVGCLSVVVVMAGLV